MPLRFSWPQDRFCPAASLQQLLLTGSEILESLARESYREFANPKLSARAALAVSGSLPENVNYAVKSSYLLGFLESVPEVSAKLKEANTKEQKFEEVVRAAEQAAVLVLVY